MDKSLRITFTVLVVFCCSACSPLRIDGPYEGKVVDAETNAPLEGVVAQGIWNESYATIAGPVGRYFDCHEVLSDKNGNFKIPGKGLLVFTHIERMRLTLFKAGYEEFGPEASWEGNKRTYKLKKMSLEERRERFVSVPGPGTIDKNRLFWREHDKEEVEIRNNPNFLFNVE